MGLFDKVFRAKSASNNVDHTLPGQSAVELTSCIIDGWDANWGLADIGLRMIAGGSLSLVFNGQSRQVPPTADISWLITWPEGCARCDSPVSHNSARLIPRFADPTQDPKLNLGAGTRFDCKGAWHVHVCSSCYQELSGNYSAAANADDFVQLLRVNAPQLQFVFKSAIYAAKFKAANKSIYNPPSYWRPPSYVCSECGVRVEDSAAYCGNCGRRQPPRSTSIVSN
jgi:hypothetical protein